MNVKSIQQTLRQFALERDWDQFHSPKNLASALSVESAELLELFQWLTEKESLDITNGDQRQRVEQEMADVLLYLLRMADVLNVDLERAAIEKIQRNAEKYPVDLVRGNATKYNRR